MERIRIEILGRVQGVGFRHFIKENADKLKLKGYVTNRDDGSVEIVAEGLRNDLKNFLKKVELGPSFSSVRGISYIWEPFRGDFRNFMIALDKGMINDQRRNFFNLGKSFFGSKVKFPKHIAIIPDGNRRWAKENGKAASEGHREAGSYEHLTELFQEAKNLDIKYLTFWVFSTENWKRNSTEINNLFELFVEKMKILTKEAHKNKIRFRHLGRKDRLPKELIDVLDKLEKETEDFKEYNVQFCLDYGGRDEVIRAINKILKMGVKEIKEGDLARYLDSEGIPDPDLIIRTSGEKRTSGFMPLQSSYSEFCFVDVNFPDFKPEHLRNAVKDYVNRNRRFGK